MEETTTRGQGECLGEVGSGGATGQGIRTYVASNQTLTAEERPAVAALGETWEAYPDDVPLRSLALKGDSRAALVPFLAHRFRPLSRPRRVTRYFTRTKNAGVPVASVASSMCYPIWRSAYLCPPLFFHYVMGRVKVQGFGYCVLARFHAVPSPWHSN